MLRLALRVGLPLLAVAAVLGSGAPGRRPLWVVVLVALSGILLTYGSLQSLRSGAKPPMTRMWETASRGARRADRLLRRRIAAVHRAQRRGRVRRVELAALETAEDDQRLSPERVRASAEALFRLVALAWDARDPRRLGDVLDPEVLARDDGLLTGVRLGRGQRLEVVGEVRVEYVGFSAPQGGRGARAVVLIEATLRLHAGENRGRRAGGELRDLCQYWTLGLRDGLWTVLAIDERAQGSHHLDEAIGAPSAAPR